MATKSTKNSKDSDPPKMYGEFRSGPIAGTAVISGATFFNKGLHYADVDGLAMFEGDIVLGTTEQMSGDGGGASDVETESLALASIGITGQQFRWPNATIPFEIDPALPNQQRVTDAIAHWQARTRIRFVPRTASHPDFVRFVPGGGCSSQVGRRGLRQDITLGPNCTAGNAIHEIGHAVGLWHEQSREDRNTFVRIVFANIDPSMQHNFLQHISDGDDLGNYDYGSIMHYPPNAFSINGQDTIIALQTLPGGVVMGQRTGLSAGDIAGVHAMYPPPIVKNPVVDIGTIKEINKDPIVDIRTIKEINKDPIVDIRTIKEVGRDPIGPIGGTFVEVSNPFGRDQAPFVVASPSRADAATQHLAAEAGARVEQIAQTIAYMEQQQAELWAAYHDALQTLDAVSQQ